MTKAIELKRQEDGSFVMELPDDQANLEQRGFLGGIARTEVAGIPLGGAIIGGGTAALVSGLMDRFVPGLTGGMAKLLAAWATVQFGSQFVGADAAKYAALFLAYDAVAEPVEDFIARITGGLGMRQAGTIDEAPEMDQAGKYSDLERWLATAA